MVADRVREGEAAGGFARRRLGALSFGGGADGEAEGLGGLEVVDAGYFFGDEGEAEDVEVLPDAFGVGGLGDHDDAGVDVPAQDYLGGGDAVLGSDLGQGPVAQPGALERAVALQGHGALVMRGEQAR